MTIDDRLARRALFVLIAAQAVIFASLCAIKYHFLLYDDIDLAIFTQALANLLRGSLETPLRGMSWLGITRRSTSSCWRRCSRCSARRSRS